MRKLIIAAQLMAVMLSSYCGIISVQPGIHVKAITFQSGMADSSIDELAS